MHSADAPSISALWVTGSRDAVSRRQSHLEYYIELAFPLESDCFPGTQVLSKQLKAFDGYGSHRTQGSYKHALGDYRLLSPHFILFIRDRFLLCCLSCLLAFFPPIIPSVGIIGTDYHT